jgi:molybdate transport system ATP-binding protein
VGPQLSLSADLNVSRNGFTLEAEFRLDDEVLTIVGPNGAGKSTLLRTLAGLEGSTASQVRFGATVWQSDALFVPPEERDLAMVFARDLLLPHLTVRRNVELTSRGPADQSAAGWADHWLDRFDLTDLAGQAANELSSGERQRVALARSFARSPAIILLDEPLSAVDAERRPRLRRQVLSAIAEANIPAIIVSHDATEAVTMGDRIMILENGRATQVGLASDLRQHPRSPFAAELVGVNLFEGEGDGGAVSVGAITLSSADNLSGPVFVTVHPRAISLHTERPEGSSRNVWQGVVSSIDRTFDLIRVSVAGPVDLTVTVTAGGLAAVDGQVGGKVWLSVKASEVRLQPR